MNKVTTLSSVILGLLSLIHDGRTGLTLKYILGPGKSLSKTLDYFILFNQHATVTASYYNNGLSFTLTADFNNSASFNSGYDQNICGAPPIEMQRDFSTLY